MSGGSEPSFAFSAASQYVMIVFTAEKSMTITQFGMCVNSSSGTPPIRIAMWQYVSGFTPNTGTKTYTDANAISTTSGISTPTFTWWNLTTPQSITRGTTYAIGLESYGTWSGGLSVVQAQQQSKRDYSQISGQPFGYTSSSGSTLPYRWGIASSTESYGYPVSDSTTINISSIGFSGNSFTIPTSMGATCSLQGIIVPISVNPNFQNSTLRLYNATSYPPTLITSKTLGTGAVPSSTIAWYDGTGGTMYLPFDTAQTLTTGVKYLVGIASSGDVFKTGKVTFNRQQDSDCLSDVQMYGVESNLTTWTESGLFRYSITPDVTNFVAASGSGGGPVIGGRLIN
jgi:hypothetical protein